MTISALVERAMGLRLLCSQIWEGDGVLCPGVLKKDEVGINKLTSGKK